MKEFTLEELAKHNGSDPSLPMLLSIRGVVFDISTGKQFYGPDGEQQQQRWLCWWSEQCSWQHVRPRFLQRVLQSTSGFASLQSCTLCLQRWHGRNSVVRCSHQM